MTAFVKSGEARCGSLAIQYRYAAGSPRPANIATTGGQRTTTSKSPRPAGPNARAPSRLETTVESKIVASVMRISLALRAITIYSILQIRRRRLPGSACAARQYDRGNGAQQNRSVQAERPVIDILQIQLHPLFKGEITATRNLPQTGESGLHAKASFLPRFFHAEGIAQRQRPWAHDAHVAQQHIDELRQLVHAGLPQPAPYAGDPRILAHLKNRPGLFVEVFELLHSAFGVRGHGAELNHAKTPLVQSDALLNEEHRAGRIHFDGNRRQQKYRGSNQEHDRPDTFAG